MPRRSLEGVEASAGGRTQWRGIRREYALKANWQVTCVERRVQSARSGRLISSGGGKEMNSFCVKGDYCGRADKRNEGAAGLVERARYVKGVSRAAGTVDNERMDSLERNMMERDQVSIAYRGESSILERVSILR